MQVTSNLEDASEPMAQRLVFLTTEQVQERFGFDARPFMERHQAGGNFIFNKLVTVDGQLLRVWLERDCASHPAARKR